MRNFTICLALIIGMQCSVSAQEEITSEKKAFYIHSWLGLSVPGLADLNHALGQAHHVAPPKVLFSRGGGFYLFFNNTRLVQLINFSTYSGSQDSGSQRTWIRGTQIGTAWGIDLRKRTRLQAIPYAGVAYSMVGLRLSNPIGGSSFINYLAGSGNEHYISNNQWLANVGLHLGASPLGKSGFAHKLDLALRAGYYLPLNQSQWKANSQKLSGGPEINSGGFYAGIVLGARQ